MGGQREKAGVRGQLGYVSRAGTSAAQDRVAFRDVRHGGLGLGSILCWARSLGKPQPRG